MKTWSPPIIASLLLFFVNTSFGFGDQWKHDLKRLRVEATELVKTERPDLLPQLEEMPDGIQSEFIISNEFSKQKIILLGRNSVEQKIVSNQSNVKTHANQVRIYRGLLSRLTGNRQIPVEQVKHLSAEKIAQKNEKILRILVAEEKGRGRTWIQGYGLCQAEEGALTLGPTEGDQTGKICAPHTNGLLANISWPLKYFNTCVRNQGNRGTCVAFATTSAVESLLAKDHQKFMNLSEQQFYEIQKRVWYPVPPHWGDGLIPLLSDGLAMLEGYRFHFEKEWHYNPSYRRKTKTLPLEYSNSCDGYSGRYCSDTNHQSRRVCSSAHGLRYCDYEAPMPEPTNVKITEMGLIFDLKDPSKGLEVAKGHLSAGIPIIWTFLVPESMSEVGPDGYVQLRDSDRLRGAHAVLMTGWVPNNELPKGAPKSEGGGYFVIKNSWGACAGHAGYYYIPLEWVKKFTLMMNPIYKVIY